jgi:hypothetical protein
MYPYPREKDTISASQYDILPNISEQTSVQARHTQGFTSSHGRLSALFCLTTIRSEEESVYADYLVFFGICKSKHPLWIRKLEIVWRL